MGYASILNSVSLMACTPFYIAGILWTLFYDTVYAFQDIEHDKKLGLKSSAITVESWAKQFLILCAVGSIGCLYLGGKLNGFGLPFNASLGFASALYAYQIHIFKNAT